MAETKRMVYDIPLRSNFMAQLVLPYDLSQVEALRLCAILTTLIFPPSSTPEAP